ncbi:hypothetical protein B0H15DRAFT_863165 [Mycena belliarum]|uniref:Uncharacterized protein n=1 Tax=Mycena belliarum TaxID=1033014 RepID=A0AAD6TRE2_9AGAR|nr:hypothetical protein B0H15DRAFT_863165 [Mycena belliae]
MRHKPRDLAQHVALRTLPEWTSMSVDRLRRHPLSASDVVQRHDRSVHGSSAPHLKPPPPTAFAQTSLRHHLVRLSRRPRAPLPRRPRPPLPRRPSRSDLVPPVFSYPHPNGRSASSGVSDSLYRCHARAGNVGAPRALGPRALGILRSARAYAYKSQRVPLRSQRIPISTASRAFDSRAHAHTYVEEKKVPGCSIPPRDRDARTLASKQVSLSVCLQQNPPHASLRSTGTQIPGSPLRGALAG